MPVGIRFGGVGDVPGGDGVGRGVGASVGNGFGAGVGGLPKRATNTQSWSAFGGKQLLREPLASHPVHPDGSTVGLLVTPQTLPQTSERGHTRRCTVATGVVVHRNSPLKYPVALFGAGGASGLHRPAGTHVSAAGATEQASHFSHGAPARPSRIANVARQPTPRTPPRAQRSATTTDVGNMYDDDVASNGTRERVAFENTAGASWQTRQAALHPVLTRKLPFGKQL